MTNIVLLFFSLTLINTHSQFLTSQRLNTNCSKFIYSDTLSEKKRQMNLIHLVDKISTQKSVSNGSQGISSTTDESYQNFLQLRETATIQELLDLTKSENSILACYAGWALIDTMNNNTKFVLQRFILNDKSVTVVSGCVVFTGQNLSTALYERYWYKVDPTNRSRDNFLFMLDSVILYNKNSNWSILSKALENRFYNETFKGQIAKLAFEEKNRLAILYLCKWYRAEFVDKIKTALVDYLISNEFQYRGVEVYYEIVEELLKFNDPEIKKIVIRKLKRDKYWEKEKEEFKQLFSKYYIFNTDYE